MTRHLLPMTLCIMVCAIPVRADHDHRPGSWGSLLPPRTHADSSGAPQFAPPVIVDRRPQRADPLPNLCLQAVDTPDGWHRYYDSDCLYDQHVWLVDLPRDCRVRLTTWGGTRDGYDAQCLFDAGFRRAR